MNVYNPDVLNDECMAAAPISKNDLAICAKALYMAITIGISTVVALRHVGKITPNAWLRWVLRQMWASAQEGNSLTRAVAACPHGMDPVFVTCVDDGERRGELDTMLLAYAEFRGYRSGQLAQQIGRTEAATQFALTMNVLLKAGMEPCRALSIAAVDLGRRIGFGEREGGYRYLSQALGAHSDVFDPFFISMLRAGEDRGDIGTSFGLLADQ